MTNVPQKMFRVARVSNLLRCQAKYSRQLSTSGACMADQRIMNKNELVARQIENDNPFETYTLKPDAGTGVHKSAPILVPSTEDKRIVGCCCEYDYNEVVWFTLHKGKEQQCECGYYFKLMDHSPLDEGITPKFGKGFGSGMGKFK